MPPITAPIRMSLLLGVLAILGFFAAGWTAGAPLAVLVGTVASIAAALAFFVGIEHDARRCPASREG